MKKLLLTVGTGLATIAPMATVIACSSDQASLKIESVDTLPEFKGTKVEDLNLSAIVTDPENPRYQKAKTFLQANGEAVGFDTTTAILKDASEQTSWINTQTDLDALIVGATDDTVAGTWSGFAKEKPVIAYDRLINTSNRTAYNWYVTFDNYGVGVLQGANILASIYDNDKIAEMKTSADIITEIGTDKLDTEATIAALGGDPADNNAGLFYNGAMDLIQAVAANDEKLSVPAAFDTFGEVAQSGWDYTSGQTFLQGAFTNMSSAERGQVKAVLAPNDGMANSAINALNRNAMNPKDIYVTGQDSNDTAITSIYNETGQDMTISKPDTILSAVAASLAAYLIANPTANEMSLDDTVIDAALAAIIVDFPDIDFEFTDDEYFSDTGNSKEVNTIKLTPKVVNKENLDDFFTITEA